VARLVSRVVPAIATCVGLVASLAAWLWPIGFGGKMPVGGDATAFSLGLMARCQRAIRSGEWPVWLDDWGFGFPGIAESQIGYYYPPHWLFYGLLPLELAYTVNLVAHLLWAMAGAVFAARVFGGSKRAAWFAGLVFGLNGFFLVHLPHHWSYTVGAWMPWAIGLAWKVTRCDRPFRPGCVLGLVLALQVLPGHFQLAFITQLGVGLVLAVGIAARATKARYRGKSFASAWWALTTALLLTMCQWAPTADLAVKAKNNRTYEYLSGFAGTPVHLVNYVAPLLFHRSPLWRPLAWDPFHTSPEEWQPYVGIVPLLLAFGAIWIGLRRSLEVKVLALLAMVGLLLSLGPYIPGFAQYCQLPGFSFFRAPARWSLLSAFALSLLSAHGLDWVLTGEWRRIRMALVGMAFLVVAWPCAVLGLIEAIFAEGRAGGPVTHAVDAGIALLPWEDGVPVATLLGRASAPRSDLSVQMGYAREGWGVLPAGGARLSRDRLWTYLSELQITIGLATGLIVLSIVGRRGHVMVGGLVALTAIDLIALGWHRGVEAAPIRPITDQSVVLARMAQYPPGTRSVDPLQNLPMAVGLAPVLAYRTLDLPVPPLILAALRAPIGAADADHVSAGVHRVVGAGLRVFSPIERPKLNSLPGHWVELEDPILAAWLYGRNWVQLSGPLASRFTLWEPADRGSVDWLLRHNLPIRLTNLPAFVSLFDDAIPLQANHEADGGVRYDILGKDQGQVLLRTRADPWSWKVWPANQEIGASLRPYEALGGWLEVTSSRGALGPESIRFRYDSENERAAFNASLGYLVVWLAVFLLTFVPWSNVARLMEARGWLKQKQTMENCP
jgi:hypothetical protein